MIRSPDYLPETVTAVLGDGSDLSVRVVLMEQPQILGSAGGTRQALPIMGSDSFFVAQRRHATDVDLARLAAAHQTSGARVTLALVPNRVPEPVR